MRKITQSLCLLLAAVALCSPASAKPNEAQGPVIKALLITSGCCHDYDEQRELLPVAVDLNSKIPVEWTIYHQRTKAGDRLLELYFIEETNPTMTPLAQSKSNQTGEMHTNIWVNEYGPNKARVCATTIGHHNETMLQAEYLEMFTRGFLWAAGKSVSENIQSSK